MPRPCAQSHQRRELVVVDALERDRVDLDLQAGRLRGVDAGQHLGEIAPARDRAELVRIERVERDVDALARRSRRARRRYFASCEPLVVSVSSSSAPACEVTRQRARTAS